MLLLKKGSGRGVWAVERAEKVGGTEGTGKSGKGEVNMKSMKKVERWEAEDGNGIRKNSAKERKGSRRKEILLSENSRAPHLSHI